MIEDAGGLARRYDGTEYEPASNESGLLVAPVAKSWRALHDILVPNVAVRAEWASLRG
jgi:hypothetical protein